MARLVDSTSHRLRGLCLAAGFEDETQAVVDTFRKLVSPWAEQPSARYHAWPSEISDDNTPIEFSVAFLGDTVEVRALFEPQADEPVLAAYRQVGIAFNERLEREFGASLDRFRRVQALFLPPDMHGPFSVWSSAVFARGRRPSFKAYLNPQARGVDRASEVVQEGLARLGLAKAWHSLESTVLRRGPKLDELKYFALDLSSDTEARVKIYVRHHAPGPDDLEMAASGADGYAAGETREFVEAMRGSAERLMARAAFTCSSFVGTEADHPRATTVYVPVCAYARDDSVVMDRMRAYMARHGLDSSPYERVVNGFANRPLSEGTGMQSWIALRRMGATPRMTVYLATETNRVHHPGSVPAPTEDRSAELLSRIPEVQSPQSRAPVNRNGGCSMREVFEKIQTKMSEYRSGPFLAFLRNPDIDPRRKLAFAPDVAHFVLTFSDLCALILPEDPATSWYQELVNANSREDEDHWQWFLTDLDALGQDASLRYSEAIRKIWNPRTIRTRRLSYELAHLGLAGGSLEKLVLVHCIEGAFKATVKDLQQATNEFTALTGKHLNYLGANHSDAEHSHTLEGADVRARLEAIEVDAARQSKLLELVERTFEKFGEFADEMLALAEAAPPLAVAASRPNTPTVTQ